MTIQDVVAAVRKHAIENYEEGGWDIVEEAMDDEELEGIVRGLDISPRTFEEHVKLAIGAIADRVRLLDDARRDVEGTAF